MSLILRAQTKATVKRASQPGYFDITVGAVWGHLAPTSGTEQNDGMNVVIALHNFRFMPGQVGFTEHDQLEIGGKVFAILLIRNLGRQMVARLREIR